MTVSVLLFSDLHLDPDEKGVSLDTASVPPSADLVLSLGDIIDDSDPEDIEYGREFLDRLDNGHTPIVCIPGNHDPLDVHEDLTAGFDHVHLLHRAQVELEAIHPSHPDSEISVVGWGCEQFNQGPGIDFEQFPRLTEHIASVPDPTRVEETVVDTLISDMAAYYRGDASVDDVCDRLDIESRRFEQALEALRDEVNEFGSLLTEAQSPPIVATHVPPFATPLDAHHSDILSRFVGSLAFRIGLHQTKPFMVLSGHTHFPTYLYDCMGQHALSPGKRGILSLEFDPKSGEFGYSWV